MKRRTFLSHLAIEVSSTAFLSFAASAATAKRWKNQIGLELYTVRELMKTDFEGVLTKVAEIGYREIEPATNYGGLEPKQFRALLDRLHLSMPSTHVGATEGPDLEKQLEGFQIMGLRYTEIRSAPSSAPRPANHVVTEDDVKRQAAGLNEHGKLAEKFGMKMLVHNHAQEFAFVDGSKTVRPYDILLAETDPSLVAMQLDVGWASVAGQNILDMFAKHPGRFELWHVKDAKGIKALSPNLTQPERMRAVTLVPVGTGEVDYAPIFAHADQAGLKHFCVEQDNAAASGDALAAAKTSFVNLKKILS